MIRGYGMYGQEQNSRENILDEYRGDVEVLLKYLPWLHKVSGKDLTDYYEGEADQKLMRIPVYDSTLLSFVKDAEKTKFIHKNYPYTYTRCHIKTPEDECRLLKQARIFEIDIFRAILSRYVLEGKRKSTIWTQGIENNVFLTALDCLNDLFFRFAP